MYEPDFVKSLETTCVVNWRYINKLNLIELNYNLLKKAGKGDIWTRFKIVVHYKGQQRNFASCETCSRVLAFAGKTDCLGLRRHTCGTIPCQSKTSFRTDLTPSLPQRVKQSKTDK
ncbi:hypothetical protein XENOCAPTIV_022291 [Xenoophorus captivus]|uniref:Uncharacterized protein n=1 Tax=Xenoophorus captivus TaxID=1517983 RepID=A0ABV0QB32_9TELE